MNVAALGRPFSLGMLYDARKDELIPGWTLWDDKTLKENSVESYQHSSAFDISASDSTDSKSSLMDISASLKASFLGGLIEVGGSAKYLNDTKNFHNQSRVTFRYKATTSFKQLSVVHLATLNTQQRDAIEKSSATHIVTGILYGANAFFVFDSDKLEASSVQDIQGHMEAVIKKIPKFNVDGKVDIKLTEEEKALTNKFSCKFYGDFILESNPATFEEAVKTYAELPKLLGENGENTVPLKVWLMPLTHLDPKAAELKKEISTGLVMKVQDALEDLKEIRMRCNDALDDRLIQNFPQIKKDLSRFQDMCNIYASNLQQTMAKKLPIIHEDEEDESSVKQLFEDRDQSSFSHEKLSEWLEQKEREINVIRSCVEMMEGTKIVQNQSELDREVLTPGVEDALCFVFTSLESADPCLDAMNSFLISPTVKCAHEVPWYYSDEVLIKMRKKSLVVHGLARQLKILSQFHFLTATIENKRHTGATIYHYKDGVLVTDDFSMPVPPPVKTITNRRDLIWYFCDLTLDQNTANCYLTLSEGNKKATRASWQDYPDHPERFDKQPQVLCRQSLTKRHYWEVEWGSGSNESVYVLLGYHDVERKGKSLDSELGFNAKSWAFGKCDIAEVKALHQDLMWKIPFPAGFSRVGVFLDWPRGTLSFYRVFSNKLSHFYTFETAFTGPLYPGLWAGKYGNYARLNLAE